MPEEFLLDIFVKFGIAAALGFLIGLEREKSHREDESPGVRDFILFALAGAITAFLAERYASPGILIVGFVGVVALLTAGYWLDKQQHPEQRPGITTEASAMLTFFLGVLVMKEAGAAAIAIAVVMLAVLSQKKAFGQLQSRVQEFEIHAAVKLLVISFVILPILPKQTLETYITFPLGRINSLDQATRQIGVDLIPGLRFQVDETFAIYGPEARNLGTLKVTSTTPQRLIATYEGPALDALETGQLLKTEATERFLRVVLSAINPYKVWLIVVLVSFISFIGYVLVKVLGANAGIGLTGLIGGLASSTVTAVSFARRSLEAPAWNRHFAIAVILASTIMFPRLLIQIAVVNYALMRNMLIPLIVMAIVGLIVAVAWFARSSREWVRTEPLRLDNPFSLKSALTFAAVFGTTLILTRLAIDYLGDRWLPLIATISGLTDADAIAFSISDAQTSGLISLDWASFNLVLGALANTFTKLLLVLWLGHRGLFKEVLVAFLVIGGAGLATMFLYYDLGAMT